MVVSVSVTGKVAVVTIDNPPVNATSQAVRQGLFDALAVTETDDSVMAVILACAGKTFVAGADVTEFGKPPAMPYLPDVIDAIEVATKPWIAALHGTVLGGGLELAMGCHARIAAPGTHLGLPEVTLGLIPGAGGTVRLPRLVPATRALEMIAGGKPITAQQALSDGLIDAIAEENLLTHALDLAKSSPQAIPTLQRDIQSFDQVAYDTLARKLRAKARGQISIEAAVSAVETALTRAPAAARAEERKTFLRLKDSDQSAALRQIFFAERKTLRDPRVKGPVRPFETTGVIGGGTMGAGIASACLMKGMAVRLVEQSADRAAAAREGIAHTLMGSAERGLIDNPDDLLGRLTTTTSYADLHDTDLVIEAVFEDMDIKKQVFATIERHTGPSTIIATNTSYLDINVMARTLKDPTRAIGLHFFSPAHVMKLLEIVLPDTVADYVVATAAAFSKRLGKIGVFAGVCDGFIGNSIMSAYRHEADLLLEEGAYPEDVDAAMQDFGFAIGIFQMQDLAGLDIAWAMRKRRVAEQGAGQDYVRIADRLCEAGRFGHKTNAGWYDYSAGHQVPSDDVKDAIRAERQAKAIAPRTFAEGEIMERILQRMRSEANAIVSEGIAQSPDDIDVVMVNGYGFPRWRGGPSRS